VRNAYYMTMRLKHAISTVGIKHGMNIQLKSMYSTYCDEARETNDYVPILSLIEARIMYAQTCHLYFFTFYGSVLIEEFGTH
jgi:hypothetical protein